MRCSAPGSRLPRPHARRSPRTSASGSAERSFAPGGSTSSTRTRPSPSAPTLRTTISYASGWSGATDAGATASTESADPRGAAGAAGGPSGWNDTGRTTDVLPSGGSAGVSRGWGTGRAFFRSPRCPAARAAPSRSTTAAYVPRWSIPFSLRPWTTHHGLIESILPSHLVGGVLQLVLRHLAGDDVAEVEAQGVAQGEDDAGDVGQLVGDLFARRGVVGDRVRRGVVDPEEVFHQLGGLAGQGHAEVLGAVELVPVARGDEARPGVAQLGDGRGVVRHGAPPFAGVGAATLRRRLGRVSSERAGL